MKNTEKWSGFKKYFLYEKRAWFTGHSEGVVDVPMTDIDMCLGFYSIMYHIV